MKLVYEGNEEETINNGFFLSNISNVGEFGNDYRIVRDNDPEREYTIKFKVEDEAKANMFIFNLIMDRNNNNFEDSTIRTVAGIIPTGISLGDPTKNNVKKILQKALEEIDNVV